MKGLWAHWVALLDDQSCDSIIDTCLKVPELPASIGGNREVDENIRASRIRWINHDTDGTTDLWKFVNHYFAWANRDYFGVDSVFTPPLQFTTYHETRRGHYKWHEDVFWETDKIYQRKLSMVIQLCDPATYEGGNLELDVHIPPAATDLRRRGTVIVFPSFVQHRVTPVTKGIRHSLVAWQEGPRWR